MSLAGLALYRSLQLAGVLQYMVRQATEVENSMTSGEWVLHWGCAADAVRAPLDAFSCSCILALHSGMELGTCTWLVGNGGGAAVAPHAAIALLLSTGVAFSLAFCPACSGAHS